MKYLVKFYNDTKLIHKETIEADSETSSEAKARQLFEELPFCSDYTVHKK
jgi:hypothetical protein